MKINLNGKISLEDKWQEILREGDFTKGRSGVKFTKKNLERVIENFKANVTDTGMTTPEGFSELPVNIDHLMGAAERDAAGWIYDLKIDQNKKGKYSLFAKIRFTELGKEKIEKELIRGYSVEIYTQDAPFLNSETGEKIPFVLTGLALTNDPFISGMQPAELSARRLNLLFKQNMETVKLMLASLLKADKISRGELVLLNTAVESLEDDQKEEVKEEVAAVETKVEETEKAAEEAGKEEGAGEIEAEKAELSKRLTTKDGEIKSLKEELSKSHSRLDKIEMERRAEKTEQAVTQLFNEGKIIGEDIIGKTTKMLLSKNEKDANEMVEFLSSQPARVDFSEKGVALSNEEKSEEKIHELAKARAEEIAKETGKPLSFCAIQAYKELEQ